MSHKGYGLEHELEAYFLRFTGQTVQDPIMDGNGNIKRTFRVPSSGAMASFKGDIRTAVPWLPRQFLVEAKHRREKSKKGSKRSPVYHLDMRLVDKNNREADQVGLMPIFVFAFKGSPTNRIHVVFRERDYEFLTNQQKKEYWVPETIRSLSMKVNKKSYTIRKDELDTYHNRPATFYHDGLQYVLVPLAVLGLIIENLKRGSDAVHES